MMWNGFKTDEFIFENHEAIVVIPEKTSDKVTLILKTEYWNAFPETEEELLKRGHYLCYIKNDNRWGTDADIDRKARFVKFVKNKYNIDSLNIASHSQLEEILQVLQKHKETLDKVKEVREYINKRQLDVKVQVDGGINRETAELVREAGADVLVSGSYIFGAEDMTEAVDSIR